MTFYFILFLIYFNYLPYVFLLLTCNNVRCALTSPHFLSYRKSDNKNLKDLFLAKKTKTRKYLESKTHASTCQNLLFTKRLFNILPTLYYRYINNAINFLCIYYIAL